MNSFKTPRGTELPLLDLHGKDYLQIPYRIMWFREEKPNWSIETEIIEQSEKHAVFKASIKDESGRILATGHKHEDKIGFSDFREKSESGAIGRALGYLGYGTQFAQELDEGTQRIADSPLKKEKPLSAQKGTMSQPIPNKAPGADILKSQTNKWGNYIIKAGKSAGKTLKSLGIGNIKASLEYWRQQPEPPKGKLKEDIFAMEAFSNEIAENNKSKINTPAMPPPITNYIEPTFNNKEEEPF